MSKQLIQTVISERIVRRWVPWVYSKSFEESGFKIHLGRWLRIESMKDIPGIPLAPKTTNCFSKDFPVAFLEYLGHCQAHGRYVIDAVKITMNTYKCVPSQKEEVRGDLRTTV